MPSPHTHFFRERRLLFQNIPNAPEISGAAAPELMDQAAKAAEAVVDGTRSGLLAVKNSLLPTQLVEAGTEKVLRLGVAGVSLGLLGLVFASGFSMITTGKQPPWLQRFLGQPS